MTAEELIEELKKDVEARKFAMTMSEKVEKQLRTENKRLKEQIEKMKFDVRGNLIFAEHNNNEIMRQKMCSMLLQWEAKYKERENA